MFAKWRLVIVVLLAAITVAGTVQNLAWGAPGGDKGKPTTTQDDSTDRGQGNAFGRGKGKKPRPTTTTTSATTTTNATTTTTEASPTTTAPTTTTTTTAPTTTTTAPNTTTTAPTTTTTAPATTTTTTTAPTTTTTLPPTTTTVPSGPVEWVSPEGVTIMIDSAGDWTVEQIYQLLLENTLDLDLVGPTLTIKVQDKDLSSTTAGVAGGPGGYYDFSATMHLKGVNSSFVTKPDAILAHEFGHAWSLYHLYLTQQGDWSAWLEFRGLAGDPRLDTTYPWSKTEMIAEDYRLLFSSPAALAQWPGQMNAEIPDARDVPGLGGFLQTVWGG